MKNQFNLTIDNLGKGDNKPIFHSIISDTKYPQFFLAAKRNSGKTNLTLNLIQKLAIPFYTKVLYISPTLTQDIIYKKTIDNIRNLIDFKISDYDEDVIREFVQNDQHEMFLKFKQNAIPKILILDDVRQWLQKPFIKEIMSKNRHLKTCIIVSSQYLKDLHIQPRSQITNLILFKGQVDERLKDIYLEFVRETETLPYETFKQIYKEITEQDHSFMFMDVDRQIIKQNLNKVVQYK